MEIDHWGIWVGIGIFYMLVFLFAQFAAAMFLEETSSDDGNNGQAIAQALILNFAMLFTIFVLLAFKL